MKQDDMEVRLVPRGEGHHAPAATTPEPSLGELFKRLTSDTADLVRSEVELARAELRETGRHLANDAARIGAAAGIALVGAVALSIFLVLGLGWLLGGSFIISSLAVTLLALGSGYILTRNAINDMKKRSIKPEMTMETLRADKSWAARRADDLKHDLTTDPTTPSTRR